MHVSNHHKIEQMTEGFKSQQSMYFYVGISSHRLSNCHWFRKTIMGKEKDNVFGYVSLMKACILLHKIKDEISAKVQG